MSDPLPIQPGAARVDRAAEPQPTAPATPVDAQGNPAFRALLDRLSSEAQALGRASETLERPADLSSVAEQAKASLNDAASLGAELLEAVRAMRLQGE